VAGVEVGQRRQVEEESVGIAVAPRHLGPGGGALDGGRGRAGAAEPSEEREGLLQREGAVAMHVIADPPVETRRLRRHRDQRRVGVDRGGRGVEAGVRDAPDAGLAVVLGDVGQEPGDRVVGVGRLVGLGPGLVGDVGPHVDELALGHPGAADVLADEDVAGALEVDGRRQGRRVARGAVGREAVRRAMEQERIALGGGGVVGDEHLGEQVDPVAHRHAVLVLAVVRADEVSARIAGGRGGRGRR
jgi:hypothetical protein